MLLWEKRFIFLYFYTSRIAQGLSMDLRADSIFFQEVTFGENAILRCRSNADNYLFEYWLAGDNIIIGPTSENFDNVKFSYKVLSGDLTIRAVSKQEEGIYTCVSRAVKGPNRQMEKVKIVVVQDWEEIYEKDPNINLIRILIILITGVLLLIGGYVVFTIWKRERNPNYLEHIDDNEGIEEELRTPSTSGFKRSKSPRRIVFEKAVSKALADNAHISTDFKSLLEKSHD